MSTQPRVLLVVKGLDLGGIERMVADLAVGLHERGVPVEVAVVTDRRDRLAGRIERAGVPLHRMGGTDRLGLGPSARLARLVRSGRYDVVHVHSPAPAVVVRLKLIGAKVRVVTTLHNSWRALHPVTRLGWWATWWRDDLRLAVSADAVDSAPRPWRRRLRVLPHAVDPRQLAAARAGAAAARTSLGLAPGTRLLVSVAAHRPAKNHPNLLRALRRLLDQGAAVHLAVVGEGPQLAANRSLAASLGVADAVSFLAPRDDVWSLIAAADVVVVASDFEGQPLVVLEALALGRPVVATAVGRVPELVGPRQGRVVAPGDPVALADAVAGVLAAPLADVETPPTSWSLDDAIDEHHRLYSELVSS